jgi:CubicO group peptidase (beta-lactamase class C family)
MSASGQNELYQSIDAHVERQRRHFSIPGVSLAIVAGGQIIHTAGFGRARPGGETPSPQTPFFIGSLTKSITALAVLQLVEAEKIELDNPVQRYLPWFRVADAQATAHMTVRHLLHQTSGLPTLAGEIPLADFDNRPCATERQARALATIKLSHPVGAAFEYSNANYNLLGLIIEAASGDAYANYIQSHILSPLGMCHTYAAPDLARQSGLAMGYRYWFGFPVAAHNMPLPHGSLPAGLLISSAEDTARYLLVFLNGGRYGGGQILTPAGIQALLRGAAEFRAMGMSVGKYGMGWFDSAIGATKLVWHSGTLPHFFAYMALLPEQDKGVVLLCNACQHWMNPVLTEVGSGVAALLAGEPPARSRFGFIPWGLRGQALIPIAQAAGVAATLRQLRRWRREPVRRPVGAGQWTRHVLLPLVPNLLLALSLKPMCGPRRRYLKLYMPDYALIAWVCGTFALLWGMLRTGLMLWALGERNKRRPA